jgi:N6-L-threonylcarbamoyladenine synthase
MRILAIETSCDETAICIIETAGVFPNENIKILGNELYSQIAIHSQYGGVYPNLAKREHEKNLVPILQKCLADAELLKETEREILKEKTQKIEEILSHEKELSGEFFSKVALIEKPEIDLIAVTNGPGLEPALWVGVGFAKALSELWDIPVMPINHMEGHIVAALLHPKGKDEYKLRNIEFPLMALLISGGHTELVLGKDWLHYEIVGNTKDDAVGEAFDKVARILGLPYPGGPEISKLAEKERQENPSKETVYPLTRPMLNSGDLNFSFSGIKTAVLYATKKVSELTPAIKQEIAKEFEDAAVEVLLTKTKDAVSEYGAKTIIIGGGVSANKKIRADAAGLAKDMDVALYIPEISASTDNALMIALAAYINSNFGKKPSRDFRAEGNLTF